VIEIGGKKLDAKVERMGLERDGEGRILSVTLTLILDAVGREQVVESFRDPLDPNWFHGDPPRWKAKISWEHQNATKEEVAAMILMDEAPTTTYLLPTSVEMTQLGFLPDTWGEGQVKPMKYFRAVVELQVTHTEEK
jgi:hypothetical protein